jgi:hypothetical protein
MCNGSACAEDSGSPVLPGLCSTEHHFHHGSPLCLSRKAAPDLCPREQQPSPMDVCLTHSLRDSFKREQTNSGVRRPGRACLDLPLTPPLRPVLALHPPSFSGECHLRPCFLRDMAPDEWHFSQHVCFFIGNFSKLQKFYHNFTI